MKESLSGIQTYSTVHFQLKVLPFSVSFTSLTQSIKMEWNKGWDSNEDKWFSDGTVFKNGTYLFDTMFEEILFGVVAAAALLCLQSYY